MDTRPIGVFDSGLGGLTAVRELRRLLPSENIIYFGDTSRVPYGGRSAEILLKYARQDVRFLRTFDIKAILVACGTVSTTALPQLRRESDIPILGVVEPACRRAAAVTRNKRVGLIATAASVRSGAYQRILQELDPDVAVTARACPLFVPLVENGRFRRGDPVIETVAREYLEPLRQEGLDTLILGCTHYPLLTDIIGDIMGPGVTLINASEEGAWELKRTLRSMDLLAPEKQTGQATLCASDQPEDFGALASYCLLNICVIWYYCIKQKDHSNPVRLLICPAIGAVVTLVIFISLDTVAHVVGFVWVAIGIAYYLVVTKVLHRGVEME